MLPKWHVLYGFVFSIILVHFFHFSLFAAAIVFLSAIFIDLDHVLLYFIETKNLNPHKFWNWSMRRKNYYHNLSSVERARLKSPHFILHGIEFLIILIGLGFVHSLFFWILIGASFHLILDFIHLFYEGISHYSIKTSQIWLLQRNKNKKSMNLS